MSFLESLLSSPPISAPSTGGIDMCYHAQLFMGSLDPKILNLGSLPGAPSALPTDLSLTQSFLQLRSCLSSLVTK